MQGKRRFLVTCAIAAVTTTAFLPGSGLGSRADAGRRAQVIPARLADAIHARLGSAARLISAPLMGSSVALSADGTTAIVGAPGVARGTGAVYVFRVSGTGSWSSTATPTATLTNKSGAHNGQSLGWAVGLSADGTTAFVAAPSGQGAAAIYVFHVSAETAWATSSTPTATLTLGALDGLSLAVSSDGTTLVTGAPFANAFAGGGYVFHASSESAWTSTSKPTATLSNTGESKSDLAVGAAVAISGDGTTVLLSDSGNPNGGGAFLYHVAAENSWNSSTTPTAVLSDIHSGANDALGNAVALSGDGTVALLGAPGAKSNTGAVDVFRSAGEAAWGTATTPTATLTAGGSAGNALGEDVALSTDGETALVTARGANAKHGAAYVFHVATEAAWAPSAAPAATLTHSDLIPKDVLGILGLSADGATALIGAPTVRFQTGAAFVYHASAASSWAAVSTPAANLTNSALNACIVPQLRRLKVSAARSALKARSCRLGKVKRVHKRGKRGRVFFQNRPVGARLPVGAKVSVKVVK